MNKKQTETEKVLKLIGIGVAVLVGALISSGSSAGFSEGVSPAPSLSELAVSDIALADDSLADLRGGFFDGSTLKITFGFESVLMVDGILQASTALNFSDISVNTSTYQVTYGGVDASSFKSSVLANGLNVNTNTNTGSSEGGLELASLLMSSPTIISNTENNRVIQYLQNYNLKIEGLSTQFSSGVSRSLTPALLQALQ